MHINHLSKVASLALLLLSFGGCQETPIRETATVQKIQIMPLSSVYKTKVGEVKRGRGKVYLVKWEGYDELTEETRKWFNQNKHTKSLLKEWRASKLR